MMANPDQDITGGLSKITQKIVWKENRNFLSSAVFSSNVEVSVGVPDHSILGSSPVVTKSLTDYPFMMPTSSNSGVTEHCSGDFIAYAINKKNDSSEFGGAGMVRVMNLATGKRGLIRDIRGLVMDMSFAWMKDFVLLAFTDTSGGFSVYQASSVDNEAKLSMRKVLEVTRPHAASDFVFKNISSKGPLNQVSWCRYIPESTAEALTEDPIPSYLLAVSTGRVVEVWLLHSLCGGPGVSLDRSDDSLLAGTKALKLRIVCKSSVTAVCISPDSTCIAVATVHGQVYFLQAEILGDLEAEGQEQVLQVPELTEKENVHEWQPHDGAAVTCLLFLDDHTCTPDTNDNSGSFWAFALTGAHNNTELKIWNCKTWRCLQVLHLHIPSPTAGPKIPQSSSAPPFHNPPSGAERSASLSPSLLNSSPSPKGPSSLRVSADNSTNFIMLTDRTRNVLYALLLDHTPPFDEKSSDMAQVNGAAQADQGKETQMATEDEGSGSTDQDSVIKRIVSISEIPVQFEPFSLNISWAKMKTYQRWKHHPLLDATGNDADIGSNGGDCAMVRGLDVHSHVLTKESLLQCSLRLQPALPSARHFCATSALLKYAPASDTAASDQRFVGDASPNASLNSTFSFCAKDGLSDLSMSVGETGASATSSVSEQPGPKEEELTKTNSMGPKHEIPLGTLLPPDHFQAPPPSAPALPSQPLVATNNLPPPTPATPPIDQSLNNKPNAALAALLLYPDTRHVSAVIAGAEPMVDPSSRPVIAVPEVSPSSEIASLLGIGSSRHVNAPKGCPQTSERRAGVPDPAVTLFGPVSTSNIANLGPTSGLHDRTGSVLGLTRGSPGSVELPSSTARSSSVPLSSAAAACSSTSSPSLEIQQILQQSDDQSSSSSSASSSRGPTQLGMAEKDAQPPQDIPQQPTSDEDQPEALRQMAASAVRSANANVNCNAPISRENNITILPQCGGPNTVISLGKMPDAASVDNAIVTAAPLVGNSNAADQISHPTAGVNNVSSGVAVSPNKLNSAEELKDKNGPESTLVSRGSDSKLQVDGGFTEEELDRQTVRRVHMKLLEEQRVQEKKMQETIKEQQLELQQKFQKKVIKIPASPAKNQEALKAVSLGTWPQVQQLDAPMLKNQQTSKAAEAPLETEPSINAFDMLKQIVPNVSLRNAEGGTPQPADAAASTLALRDILTGSEGSVQLTCEQLEARILASPVPAVNGDQQQKTNQKAPEPLERVRKPSVSIDRPPQTEANNAVVPDRPEPNKAKHVDISTAELKELRSLLHATQQQVTKLNKKVDELSASHKSQTSQAVASSLRPGLEATLRLEIKQSLPNCVTKAVEHAINQKLSHDLQRMVSATEARLMDNIAKLVHSRSLSAAISENVAATVAPSVTGACKEAYSKLVLPGLNSVTSRTLQQFNDLFLKGTTDYVTQVKGEVSNVVTCIEGSKTSSVREMEAARSTLASMASILQDQYQQQQNALQLITSQVLNENVVRRIVSEEVTRALQRVPPPDTPTPNTFYGPDKAQNPKQVQLQLEQFIASKQFNSAFKQALSANDLSQVLFVCERVNRETLMTGGKSKLSQEVLMSLINQLSHDLGQKTDLKMKFLEDAMLCIDSTHPVTRDHIRSVASCLKRNLQLYLDTNPPLQTQNRFRMLLLAATHHAGGA